MTEVKICGMMSAADVTASSDADYQGFVLMTESRRCLTSQKARKLMAIAKQKKVIVTTLTDIDGIARLADDLRPDVVQAHSVFPPEEMERLRALLQCELWLLIPVGDKVPAKRRLEDLKRFADKVVLDSPCTRGGGSGTTHDWEVSAEIARSLRPVKSVLAGGLNAENVTKAIGSVRPDVVDVSSGVEKDGVKNAMMIKIFIENARKM
jgi:phosphoribosylanthranilate isomerase